MTYRSKAFRDLCRDRSCACCGAQDGTIVPAHRNGGGLKGMGLKSPDSWVLPLCFGCHKDYDEGRWRDADAMWLGMYATFVDELLVEGRLALPGVRMAAERGHKPSPKIIKHSGYHR